MWWECKIDSGKFKFFKFRVQKNKTEFKIHFDVNVSDKGLDIRFLLCTYEDYQKITQWMNNKVKQKLNSKGQLVYDKDKLPVMVDIPKPEIQAIFEFKTSILNITVDLSSGTYALLLDNTYSMVTGKNLSFHIMETWNEKDVKEDLPIVQLLDGLPTDVITCVKDANDCYVAGHYNQCSIILRKGIELATKIKLLQSGVASEELLDQAGNEGGLSFNIKLLKDKKLLSSKNSSDMERIKWFGNVGAHGTMRITEQDIRDNIEPKTRNLFTELDLKT